jgi:hypothetical protein
MSNSAYSPIQHLAHALFLNYDPNRALMVMLNAYFDASASQQGTRVMTMAGFVSTEKKWVKFETEWNGILQHYEIPYFHMKDFTGSTGAFKTWEGKEERRINFLIDLIRVAKKRVHKGFMCSVRLEDFEEVNRDFKLREHWGCEYSFVGMSVVSDVMNWKKKHFPRASIKYILEDGDSGNADLKRCLKSSDLPYSFTPKKEKPNSTFKYITPFQLADFAAWESRAIYARYHDGHYNAVDPDDPVKILRKSFQELYKQIPLSPRVFTNDGLRRLCHSKNLNRNTSSSSRAAAVDNHPSSRD